MGGALVEHHAGGEQLEFEQLCDGVDFFGDDASEAEAAGVGREQEADFAEVAGPVGGVVVEVAFAEQLVAVEAEHGVGFGGFDFGDPFVDGVFLGDVAAEEDEVVGGEAAGEGEEQVLVAGLHEAEGDLVAVAERGGAGVAHADALFGVGWCGLGHGGSLSLPRRFRAGISIRQRRYAR